MRIRLANDSIFLGLLAGLLLGTGFVRAAEPAAQPSAEFVTLDTRAIDQALHDRELELRGGETPTEKAK